MSTPSESLQNKVIRRLANIPGLLDELGPDALRGLTPQQCEMLDGVVSDDTFSGFCKAFMGPGSIPDKMERAEMKARQVALEAQVMLHRTSKTTHSEIGQGFYNAARVVENMDCLADIDEALLSEVCGKVAAECGAAQSTVRTRTAGGGFASSTEQRLMEGASGPTASVTSPDSPRGLTLKQLIAAAGYQGSITEDQMQKVLVPALKTLGAAGSDAVLVDTSSRGFQQPTAMPDATSFAVAGLPTYATVVVYWEFKLADVSSARWQALGQHVGNVRSCFSHQDRREFMVAVTVTMNSSELFRFSHIEGALSLVRSGLQPFSFDATSPGLRWLIRLMRTPMARLGYTPLPKPQIISNKGLDIQVAEQIGRGTGHGTQSLIFHATVDGAEAIIKLNPSPQEGRLLEKLIGVNGMVQLLEAIEDEHCCHAGDPAKAVIISPYAQPLRADDDLLVFAQVVYDVSAGLDGAAARGVAQRDVTPRNFGRGPDGRGVLYDLSAGKYIEGHDWTSVIKQDADSPASNLDNTITGTTLWAPVSVLEGYAHTVSSQLEGLFLSVLSIACDDRLDGYKRVGSSTHEWSNFRQAAMLRVDLYEENCIRLHLRALIRALHELFYPMVKPSGKHRVPTDRGFMMREYRMDVTAAEVQAVCLTLCKGLKTYFDKLTTSCYLA